MSLTPSTVTINDAQSVPLRHPPICEERGCGLPLRYERVRLHTGPYGTIEGFRCPHFDAHQAEFVRQLRAAA